MSVVDPSTPPGAQAAERLPTEVVIWFVSVSPTGRPAPTPVWFWWDGADEVVIRTQPGTKKLRNVAANPHVALHLNSTADGGRVVVLAGEARVDPDGITDDEKAAILGKYAEAIRGLGTDGEGFIRGYSETVRVTLTGLRGF
ncbi:hypothetical protein GCM10025864_34710 [Luteimicrobium album]|uniref:Pyridoxamine 5'-phosphate oxidase N-terminal domain-containing protein n=1 Tax=Luteimicrobium album TaxID=1054550 RepID=A0ABQ6I669_9MICO|nr:TIGR03667 family PPOX class F420-dependent oxidoreductase [Luteimicrobium album]GMA25712.1 hypothetical protein GCM10025864_34710 [Luteimicrobium album]